MLGTFIIAFREVIEGGLIVGIVLAATRGIPGRGRWIGLGVVGGGLGAGLVALFAGRISSAAEGVGQELFNAAVLTIAVLMLAWHNAWMSRHGRELAGDLRTTGEAVRGGQRSAAALAIVVGAAILREGAELVLFLYGLVASGASGAEVQLGAVLGVATGVAMSGLSYVGLVALPTRRIFVVTSWLIVLLAAGMAAQAAQFYTDAGWITGLDRPLWNTSWLMSDASIPGRALHALIGYTDRPTGVQVLTYLCVVACMLAMARLSQSQPRQASSTSTAR